MNYRLSRRGQGIWEYSLTIAFIALVCVVALSQFGSHTSNKMYGGITTEVTKATTEIQSQAD
jgi:Flp pilus assembly pilin Flp